MDNVPRILIGFGTVNWSDIECRGEIDNFLQDQQN